MSSSTPHRIALVPGDGIGREVVPAARRVLDAVCERRGLALDYAEYDWSCERYEREGAMMPDDALDRLAE
ncbi:isocitrate/isopropylmalate family dehydrogenase, partial [Actinomadura welshii]